MCKPFYTWVYNKPQREGWGRFRPPLNVKVQTNCKIKVESVYTLLSSKSNINIKSYASANIFTLGFTINPNEKGGSVSTPFERESPNKL